MRCHRGANTRKVRLPNRTLPRRRNPRGVVARNIAQIPPIASNFVGASDNFTAMSMTVTGTDDDRDEITAAA